MPKSGKETYFDVDDFLSQKYFIQGLASVIPGEPIPMLYPEGMIFPSIFWKATEGSCSILGAIPSSLLTNSSRNYGIANVRDHMRNRLTLSGTATSTSQHYMHYAYDSCVNLTLNNQDSRIVLNRGLTVGEDKKSSLQVKSKNDSFLSDSIDSKQMVKNLCSSMRYHKMSFFLTFTCNQAENFGVAPVKNWVDSSNWHENYPGFDKLKDYEKEEVINGMQQASCVVVLRNWMETRKLFIDYLATSDSSPYSPVKSIFARDEYQSEAGNLPHIHAMLEIDVAALTPEQRRKLDELIRASICDIVKAEEVEEYIEHGIFKCVNDVFEMEKDAEIMIPHKCNKRCKRRVGPGDGPENFKCRKLNNLKVSTDNTKHTFLEFETDFSQDCIQKLIGCGLAGDIVLDECGTVQSFKSDHPFFHPKLHYTLI